MDSKQFVKLILFVLTYELLSKDSRYVLMALMEYQNMFKLEEKFNVSPYYFYEKFDLNKYKLHEILSYLNDEGWIFCTENEKYYNISINYIKIDSHRIRAIEYYKKRKESFIK